jgi:hypothetical protein
LVFFYFFFFIFNNSFAVDFNGKFIQGPFIIGKTHPNSSVSIDKKKIKVSLDGYFAFGFVWGGLFDVVIRIAQDGGVLPIVV